MFRIFQTLPAVMVLLLTGQSVVHADNLFRLIQPEAAACLHVSGLSASIARLRTSAFAGRIQASPVLAELAGHPQVAELSHVRSVLESALQRPLDEAVESLCGRNVVLAMYAVSGREPDFVLLLEADHPASIDAALKAWRQLDGVEGVEHDHRGVTCWSFRKPGRSAQDRAWIARFDTILAVTLNAARMERLIDLHLDGIGESLAAHEPFAAALAARPATELLAVYLNPRQLDSHLSTGESPLPRALLDGWQRCRWLTLRLQLTSEPEEQNGGPEHDRLQVNLIADYDSAGVPDWWQEWCQVAGNHSLPLEQIPADALFAMCGQFSADSLKMLIRQQFSDGNEIPNDVQRVRRVGQGLLLGLDPYADVLPAMGPDWLAFCVPRPGAASGDFPVDAIIALELRPSAVSVPNDSESSHAGRLTDALDNALLTGLNLLAAEHNSRTRGSVAVIRHRPVADGLIRWAEPVARFRPAYAVSSRYLLIASSPDLCERFLAREAAAGSVSRPASEEEDPVQWWQVRSTVARSILREHRDWFLWKARRDNVSDDEAVRRLEELEQVLKLADSARATVTLNSEQIRASLSVAAARAVASE